MDPQPWGCYAGGMHALRERTGRVVCPLSGVEVLQRVVVTISGLGVVPVSSTRITVKTGYGVGCSSLFCWRGCVGKRFDLGC
jgi:alanine dehydrogenase